MEVHVSTMSRTARLDGFEMARFFTRGKRKTSGEDFPSPPMLGANQSDFVPSDAPLGEPPYPRSEHRRGREAMYVASLFFE